MEVMSSLIYINKFVANFEQRITSCCTRINYSLRSKFTGEQSVRRSAQHSLILIKYLKIVHGFQN